MACVENGKRGYAALKTGLFPLIKDCEAMTKRLDGKIVTGEERAYCTILPSKERSIVQFVKKDRCMPKERGCKTSIPEKESEVCLQTSKMYGNWTETMSCVSGYFEVHLQQRKVSSRLEERLFPAAVTASSSKQKAPTDVADSGSDIDESTDLEESDSDSCEMEDESESESSHIDEDLEPFKVLRVTWKSLSPPVAEESVLGK